MTTQVIRCSCSSTESVKYEGSVFEVVFQTDEMYFTWGMFPTEELALQVADAGNAKLHGDIVDKGELGFQIREHKLIASVANVENWTNRDFIETLDGWDIEDYFKPEDEDEDDR